MQREYLPINSSERIHEIDAVRGFALLGILMMNIMSFSGPQIEDQLTGIASDIYSGPVNSFVIFLINTFVTANFYTMFSFLFGLGFYIFLSRAERKQGSTGLLFTRRMAGLLLFGIIHAIFIWYGDILTVYAITGIILLVFYRFRPVINLTAALMIMGVATVVTLLFTVLMYLIRDVDMGSASGMMFGINMNDAASGSYMDIVGMNISILSIMSMGNIVTVPLVLAMFLLGLYAGQKGYFQNLSANRGLIRKVAIIGLGLGLPVKILTGYATTYEVDDMVWAQVTLFANTLGGPLMAIGYIAAFLLIVERFRGLGKLLQPVGQMALTNYIFQSVLMTVFFYGFGFFDTIEAVWFPLIVILTFIIQIIISRFWMARFSYGPLEWIWRTITYGRILPIKR